MTRASRIVVSAWLWVASSNAFAATSDAKKQTAMPIEVAQATDRRCACAGAPVAGSPQAGRAMVAETASAGAKERRGDAAEREWLESIWTQP
ncbi:MAG TPA: hypothetical protein VMT17_14310 [Anaeromyxobacteraceae bacterium]|nr:hypothetical protein [Anaeromyxobacteraceae bacterium]